MSDIVCSNCKEVFTNFDEEQCPRCGASSPVIYDFKESDEFLKEKAAMMRDTRRSVGLEGLVGGLNSIIINTEPNRQKLAVKELLAYSGFDFETALETDYKRVCVLKKRNSANILVTSRLKSEKHLFLSTVFQSLSIYITHDLRLLFLMLPISKSTRRFKKAGE